MRRCTLLLAFVLAMGFTQTFAQDQKKACPERVVPLETPSNQDEQRETLLGQANECVRKGARAQAIALITEVIKRNPSDAEAYVNRGSLQTTLGEMELAINDFTAAIRLNPNLSTAWYNRATTLTHVGRYDSAIADFTEAMRLQPQFPAAYYNRGLVKTELGRFDAALADYTKAIEQDPKLTYCYLSRGTLYLAMGEYQSAIDDFSKQLENAITYGGRREAYEAPGEHSKQQLELRTDAVTYSRRGEAYEALGELQKALSDFQAAGQLDPKLESATEGLARLSNVEELQQHPDDSHR